MAPVLLWSEWFDLADGPARRGSLSGSGLYRVRDRETHELLYVGQTKSLRGRLSQLAGLYRDEIPYNDPHTGAPCLWVLRVEEGRRFEASVCSSAGDPVLRKAAECLVVSEYRHEVGHSPYANFGRMPEGWVKSTQNNARLVTAGLRRRGYQDPAAHRSASHPPVFDTGRDPQSADWAGLRWTSWGPPAEGPKGTGVYRLRSAGAGELVYIGQGAIGARLISHLRKAKIESHGQQAFFAPLEASWCLMDIPSQQQLEVECDLIAGHVLRAGHAPPAQFRG